MKVYKKYLVFENNQPLYAYFIFEVSKAKHERLKKFAGRSEYWFSGLTGTGWSIGGFYPNGLINPHLNLLNNVQGYTDGIDVYLLREVRREEPTKIKQL